MAAVATAAEAMAVTNLDQLLALPNAYIGPIWQSQEFNIGPESFSQQFPAGWENPASGAAISNTNCQGYIVYAVWGDAADVPATLRGTLTLNYRCSVMKPRLGYSPAGAIWATSGVGTNRTTWLSTYWSFVAGTNWAAVKYFGFAASPDSPMRHSYLVIGHYVGTGLVAATITNMVGVANRAGSTSAVSTDQTAAYFCFVIDPSDYVGTRSFRCTVDYTTLTGGRIGVFPIRGGVADFTL
jgi:hypothetical protein